MREGKDKDISRLHASDSGEHEPNWGDLQEALGIFRDSLRASAERPGPFWRGQHKTIVARLDEPASRSKYRSALLWAPAAAVVLLCLFLFVESSKAPTSDIAAGSDQNLLVEIERALNQDLPDALAPAALLRLEIERADNSTEQVPATK